MDKKENGVLITQDKIVDLLMHAATRDEVQTSTTKLESRIDRVESRIDRLDSKIDTVEDKLLSKMDKQFMFLISFITVSIISPIAVGFISHYFN